MRTVTKKQIESSFRSYILPSIRAEYEQDGRRDIPARSEAWNNYVDSLARDRVITRWQADNWTHPACCN